MPFLTSPMVFVGHDFVLIIGRHNQQGTTYSVQQVETSKQQVANSIVTNK